jgi:hypothetical protein
MTPRERGVLLAAAGVERAGDAVLRERLAQPIDWPGLMRLAAAHGVLPLVCRSLGRAGDGLVPPSVMDGVRDAQREHACRTLLRARTLLQVLDLLARHGIEATPLKGLSLAVDAYGDVTLRQFVDLDILIDPRHLDAVYDLLPAIGLRPSLALDRAQRQRLLRTARELAFCGRHDVVEIQWALAERFLLPERDDEDLRRPTRTLTVLGTPVQALSEEAVLTFLCLHGTKHGWHELRWIADVAHFVHAHPALDWDGLWSAARRRGHARMLALGLRLAGDVCGLNLPSDVEAKVCGDGDAARLALQAASQLFVMGREPGLLGTWARFIRSRERWRDRAICALDLLAPKPGDWLELELPHALYPLYYATRPFRLLAAHRPTALRYLRQPGPSCEATAS